MQRKSHPVPSALPRRCWWQISGCSQHRSLWRRPRYISSLTCGLLFKFISNKIHKHIKIIQMTVWYLNMWTYCEMCRLSSTYLSPQIFVILLWGKHLKIFLTGSENTSYIILSLSWIDVLTQWVKRFWWCYQHLGCLGHNAYFLIHSHSSSLAGGQGQGVSHYYNSQLIRRKLVTFNLLKSPTKQQNKEKPVSLQLKSSGFDTIVK